MYWKRWQKGEYVSMVKVKQREIWVDNVKVVACILVVLGHFFQSMTKAGILPANDLYKWFDQTIYYFHVPLFFICSGYLYQKFSNVRDIHSWKKNVLKKLLVLGVPYLTFSLATWLLKTLFSSAVNDEIGGLGDTLLFHPASPYWYLYALLLLFVITPTFQNRRMAVIGLIIALVCKALVLVWYAQEIQAVLYILNHEIWFVIGMCLSVFDFKKYLEKKSLGVPIATGLSFLFLSIWVYAQELGCGLVSFLLGLLACFSVVALMEKLCESDRQSMVFGYLAEYTMPIFLMHTLFAAPIRTVLFKLGVQNVAAHIVLGIAASFVGPIVAAQIMKKMKWPEFFLYPEKFMKIK